LVLASLISRAEANVTSWTSCSPLVAERAIAPGLNHSSDECTTTINGHHIQLRSSSSRFKTESRNEPCDVLERRKPTRCTDTHHFLNQSRSQGASHVPNLSPTVEDPESADGTARNLSFTVRSVELHRDLNDPGCSVSSGLCSCRSLSTFRGIKRTERTQHDTL
jgi:hypothetical protein